MNRACEGMKQCITTQMRNVDPKAVVQVVRNWTDGRQSFLHIRIGQKEGWVSLLMVAEENITRCITKDNNEGFFRAPEDLSEYDAVAVFYEPAWVPGGTWEDSSGNKYKDDYRRIAYVEALSTWNGNSGMYCEIVQKMTESSVRNLLNHASLS